MIGPPVGPAIEAALSDLRDALPGETGLGIDRLVREIIAAKDNERDVIVGAEAAQDEFEKRLDALRVANAKLLEERDRARKERDRARKDNVPYPYKHERVVEAAKEELAKEERKEPKTPLQLAFSAMLREVAASAEPFMEELKRVFPIRRSAHALREALAEENPGALYAEGFDEAFAGVVRRYGQAPLACYDRAACIQILMSESVDAEAPLPAFVTQEEAEEYFDFNVIGAFMGPGTPVFIDLVRAPPFSVPVAPKGEKP